MKHDEMSHELLKQTMWLIRRYYELVERYEEAIGGTPDNDGMPHGSGVGDPTGQAAIIRIRLKADIDAIDHGLSTIPEEYRSWIWRHIQFGEPFPEYAHYSTWKRWMRRFAFEVAKYRGDI